MVDRRGNPDKAQHRVAAALSKIVGAYVDPWDVEFYAVARGYWAHNRADVQRWTGQFVADGHRWTIGSWGVTLSRIRAGCRFEITDTRDSRNADNHFQLEAD